MNKKRKTDSADSKKPVREEQESPAGYSAWETRENRYRNDPSDYDLAMMCRGGDDDD